MRLFFAFLILVFCCFAHDTEHHDDISIPRYGFLGGRYIMFTLNTNPYQRSDSGRVVSGSPSGIGIRGGTISYLTAYMALRGYFGFDILHDKLGLVADARSTNNGLSCIPSFGLDVMFDFGLDNSHNNYVGIFLGFGGGIFLYRDTFLTSGAHSIKNIRASGIVSQFGVSAIVFHKHRVELSARLLPTRSVSLVSHMFQSDYEPYLGYSYRF